MMSCWPRVRPTKIGPSLAATWINKRHPCYNWKTQHWILDVGKLEQPNTGPDTCLVGQRRRYFCLCLSLSNSSQSGIGSMRRPATKESKKYFWKRITEFNKQCLNHELVELSDLPRMSETFLDELNSVCQNVFEESQLNCSDITEREKAVSQLERYIRNKFGGEANSAIKVMQLHFIGYTSARHITPNRS